MQICINDKTMFFGTIASIKVNSFQSPSFDITKKMHQRCFLVLYLFFYFFIITKVLNYMIKVEGNLKLIKGVVFSVKDK